MCRRLPRHAGRKGNQARLAASAALAVSTVPIKEVISEVRVSRIDGKYKINPTRSEMEKSDLDFIVAATENNIMMVEGEAKECSEEDFNSYIETGEPMDKAGAYGYQALGSLFVEKING